MIWCLNLVNTVIMFLANAEEFYTGMMRTNINGVGVTEIQFMQMAGLGFQGFYAFANPGAKVGFFNRSIGFLVKEKFGFNYPQNALSKFEMEGTNCASWATGCEAKPHPCRLYLHQCYHQRYQFLEGYRL
mgnify:CR=1 FL=1